MPSSPEFRIDAGPECAFIRYHSLKTGGILITMPSSTIRHSIALIALAPLRWSRNMLVHGGQFSQANESGLHCHAVPRILKQPGQTLKETHASRTELVS